MIALGLNQHLLAGDLLADRDQGDLKPTCPAWLLRTTIYQIEMGLSPELEDVAYVLELAGRLVKLEPDQFEDVYLAFPSGGGENNRSPNAKPA